MSLTGWEPPSVGPVTCPSWQCRGCGHQLYLHGKRKEPNSGLRYYGACSVRGCPCTLGQNHRYPQGLIDS